MARVPLPESRVHARRRRRRVTTVLVGVVLFFVLFGGFAWLSHASFLRISNITVSGSQTLPTSTIVILIQQELAGSYWYVFPKNNILFYPKSRISASLLSSLPVLSSADVKAENFQSISITVVERHPKALWCGALAASPAPCFFLDEGGVAYGAALAVSSSTNEGGGYIKYYGSLTSSTTPKHYLTASEFSSLSALIDTLASSVWSGTQHGEIISSVWVDEHNDVYVGFPSGFRLIFTLLGDGGDVYQHFMLALGSEPFKAHPISDFEYLDLRFGDKLYYKLK